MDGSGVTQLPPQSCSSGPVFTPFSRGLQVPSRHLPSDGFYYPPGLKQYNISKIDWDTFCMSLTAHIDPHRTWWISLIIMYFCCPVGVGMAYPLKIIFERKDFMKCADLTLKKIAELDRSMFRPKGLIMRLDLPIDGRTLDVMDCYHKNHVDDFSLATNSRRGAHIRKTRRRMLKRPRIIIESLSVLDDPEKAREHGWTRWDEESRAHIA